ncbi:MAG: ElyC/SanA/YdcF family protein [Desulfotomaculaceae bacterium]|nr:ElyC/SanA/YdcF family protein [Desulfotomaculaceae bacterium]
MTFRHQKVAPWLLIAAGLTVGLFAVDCFVQKKGTAYIVAQSSCPNLQAAVVLGAYASPDGWLCPMLADRVTTAVELYKDQRVQKIIMSGDHGQTDYDEVNQMRRFAEKLGVPPEDIFMDHAGFSTFDSMYRAKQVFLVDSAVVVTQSYHLPRAVYSARALGIEAIGVSADRQLYAGSGFYNLREIPARLKIFAQIHLLHAKPRFLGEAIPVSGDGRQTRDGL